MKRVIASFIVTVAGLVALLSFKTHTPELAAATKSVASSSSSSGQVTAATSTSSSSTATATANSGTTKTITGDSEDTRWGPVQVKITVNGSKITAVDVVDYPTTNGRDQEINSYAVPELVSQALSAQSAKVDGVSGATYTTEGFKASLQSAIDKM